MFTDHASLVGLERKCLSSVTNGRLVRMLEKTRGYNIEIKHIKGSSNKFADALSRKPLTTCQAPEFPLFPNSCVARAVYGVRGEPEMGLDIQNIAEVGKECEEYRAIVEFIRSGEEVKKSPVNHPVRAMAAMQQVMGIEETAKGPVVMVEGTRVMIPRGARKQMLALLHESHLAEGAMIATARRLWWWPGLNNEVRDLYRNCQA